MRPLDDLLTALLLATNYMPKRSGQGYLGRCPVPAHDDHDPSLSVREGDKGGLLIKCHAGCDPGEVLAAIQWSWADVQPPDERTNGDGRRTIVETYSYTDEQGVELFQVVRYRPKTFRQRHQGPDGQWVRNIEGVRRVVYRLPDVLRAVAAGERIYVVEGEKDVAAMERAGVVATCNPMGAGSWASTYDATFANADVTIVADADAEGRKHAATVAEHLREVAKSVRVVEPAHDNDVAQMLGAGRGLDDLVSVTSVTSPTLPTAEGESVSAGQTEFRSLRSDLRTGAWLDAQHFAPLRYHLPGVIPEGLALLIGAPKIGKSWLLLALALAKAMGGRCLGLTVTAGPALYLALEDSDRRLQSRCRKLLAGDPIPAGFEYFTRVDPGAVLETISAWLDEHRDEEPVVILDTLGKVMPQALPGESSYQRDYRIGSWLKGLVDDVPGAGLVVAHHDRKAEAEDFVQRVSGTNGLAGAADTIVVVARSRHKEQGRINVTGRDVSEGEYVASFDGAHGLWTLAGGSLTDAATKASTERVSKNLGDTSAEVVAFVSRHPDGVTVGEVALGCGIEKDRANRSLAQLTEGGRIRRIRRGVYGPTVTEMTEVTEVGEVTEVTETAAEQGILDDFFAGMPTREDT